MKNAAPPRPHCQPTWPLPGVFMVATSRWSPPPPTGSSKAAFSFSHCSEEPAVCPLHSKAWALSEWCGSRCGLSFSPVRVWRSWRQGPERVGDKASGGAAHLPGWRCIIIDGGGRALRPLSYAVLPGSKMRHSSANCFVF